MNILICTIKSWNLQFAKEYAETSSDNVKIISMKEELTSEMLGLYQPEFIFFPHWSWMIPETIFSKYNCIVFHMTDLPYGRGGSPLQNLIARGMQSTMISAIQVTENLDAGAIYLKTPLELFGNAEEIFIRAAKIIFQSMIPAIINDKIKPFKQIGKPVIFDRKKPEDGQLLEDMRLEQIYDYIRMLDAEGYPRAFIQFGHYKLYFSRGAFGYKRIKCDVEIVEDEYE